MTSHSTRIEQCLEGDFYLHIAHENELGKFCTASDITYRALEELYIAVDL